MAIDPWDIIKIPVTKLYKAFPCFLNICQKSSDIVRHTGSDSTQNQCLENSKKVRTFIHVSLEDTDDNECESRDDTGRDKASEFEDIGQYRKHANGNKRDECRQSNNVGIILVSSLFPRREVRSDWHRASVSEQIRDSQNHDCLLREVSACRTSYDSKCRHNTIDTTVDELRQIEPEERQWSLFSVEEGN